MTSEITKRLDRLEKRVAETERHLDRFEAALAQIKRGMLPHKDVPATIGGAT